jgi:hypothetical protein
MKNRNRSVTNQKEKDKKQNEPSENEHYDIRAGYINPVN